MTNSRATQALTKDENGLERTRSSNMFLKEGENDFPNDHKQSVPRDSCERIAQETPKRAAQLDN